MKERNKLAILVVLAVAAALVWKYALHNQPSPSQTTTSLESMPVLAVENPQIRWAELTRAQETEYKSNGRNPFSMIKPPSPADEAKKREKPKPVPVPVPVQADPPAPTVATLPPNIKFFGYGAVPAGSPRRAFFTDGDDVYVVPEGDTLLGRYRILKIGNTNLEFQEISSGLRGTAILEEPAQTPNA